MSGWLSGYKYRRKMTIDHSLVPSARTNEPVLVNLSDLNFDFNSARSDGYDIRFTSDDGETLLNFDREVHGVDTGDITYSSDLTTSKTATASSGSSASYALDDSATAWTSTVGAGMPQWWKVDLGSGNSRTVMRYSIQTTGDSNGQPNAWSLQASNTGNFSGEQTTLDTRSVQLGNGTYYYDITNSTAYRYYRIYFTGSRGTYVQILEFQLFEGTISGAGNYASYHVKIPSISNSIDTDFYMYYGKTIDIDGSNASGTWDSNYKAVWHLKNKTINGTSNELIDSTSNAHHATGVNSPTSLYSRLEGIYRGVRSTGNPGKLTVPDSNDLDLTGDFTFEFFVRCPTTFGSGSIFGKSQGGGTNPKWIINYNSFQAGKIMFYVDNSNYVTWTWSPSINTDYWCVLKRLGNTWTFYVNNVSLGNVSNSMSVPNTTQSLNFFTDGESAGWFAGILDEVRLSNGYARSADYIQVQYYSQIDQLLTYGSEESVDIDFSEEVTMDDDWSLLITPDSQSFEETININDTWNFQTNPDNQEISDSLLLSDGWELLTNPETVEINDTINLSDSWLAQLNPDNQSLSEIVNLSDSWSVTIDENIDYPSKIISYNPLILVTDSDPALIVEIDIADPTTPVKMTSIITGCKNAKDVILNDTSDYFYVLCAEGKIVKIEKADLDNQTIINTGETDILKIAGSLSDYLRLFASTDDSDGELVMIDEADIKKINTDFRFIKELNYVISTQLNTILGKLLNTDFRFIAETSKTLKTDFRWLKDSYTDINYGGIDYTDWQVKINGTDLVPLNDVNMKSIQIVHNVDEEYNGSTATFILNRRHDKLDYDNLGSASQITNQNNVIILVNGVTEFTGKIAELNVDSETETVNITAYGTKPSSYKNNISIPLPSINEQIHLYHCLMNNVSISNPYLDPNDKSARYYKGIKVSLGEQIEQNILRLSSLGSVTDLAENIESGDFIPKQNWTYFWLALAKNFVTGRYWGTLRYLGTSLSSMSTDTWKINGVAYKYQKQYDDILTLLGDGSVEADDFIDTKISNTSAIISALQSNSYIDGSGNILTKFKELQSYVDLDIPYTTNEKNLIYEVVKNKLGYYLGSAPYKEVAVTNGKKITKERWEDRKDGLYEVKDEGYDYVNYAKIVAGIEYDKIKNINGTILPITSATIDISLDAYYYYNIHLLSRINITNTTTPNIYNSLNGFPVGVKTITISSDTMKVSLQCDNQKSQEELEALDDTYPNEKDDAYFFEKEENKIYSKFDPNKWEYPT